LSYIENFSFAITPHTRVSFSAFASVAATTTVGSAASDAANAHAAVHVFDPAPEDSNGNQFNGGSLEVNASFVLPPGVPPSSVCPCPGESHSSSDLLAAQFVNLTDHDLTGRLIRYVNVGGSTRAVVPEAEIYALMLVGLGFVALVLPRRTHQTCR